MPRKLAGSCAIGIVLFALGPGATPAPGASAARAATAPADDDAGGDRRADDERAAVPDGRVTADVKMALASEEMLDGSDIRVETVAGVVTLRGRVASEAGRQRATEVAAAADGVVGLVDELRVAAEPRGHPHRRTGRR